MQMEDWTAAGTLSRLGDGAWSVAFAEPSTLAGVVLDFSGGEVTASYKGLGFSVPQSAMPAKSVLSLPPLPVRTWHLLRTLSRML